MPRDSSCKSRCLSCVYSIGIIRQSFVRMARMTLSDLQEHLQLGPLACSAHRDRSVVPCPSRSRRYEHTLGGSRSCKYLHLVSISILFVQPAAMSLGGIEDHLSSFCCSDFCTDGTCTEKFPKARELEETPFNQLLHPQYRGICNRNVEQSCLTAL